MTQFNQDILIASLFITGIWSFISGLFVVSTLLFAGASLFSTMSNRSQLPG